MASFYENIPILRVLDNKKVLFVTTLAVIALSLLLPALVYEYSLERGKIFMAVEDSNRVLEVKEKRDRYLRELAAQKQYHDALNEFAALATQRNIVTQNSYTYEINIDQQIVPNGLPTKIATLQSAESKYYFPSEFVIERDGLNIDSTLEQLIAVMNNLDQVDLNLQYKSKVRTYN